jgi:hypothetical protein
MSDFKIVKLLNNPVVINLAGGGITPLGAYNPATAYVLGDSVSYNGTSYIAIQPTTGNLPTNTTYWQILAEKGDIGAIGATGPTGPAGSNAPSDHTLLSNIGTNTHAQIDTHIANTSNPHSVTKAQVGLPLVDNTSDLGKPISTATQTALNLKEDSTNKTTNFTGNTGSNTLFPTVKAIFDALVGYLASYQPLLGYTPANETLSNLPSTSIGADLLPDTDGFYNIGASGQNWNNIRAKTIGYDGGTAINLDSKKIFDGAVEESIDFEARILKDSASLGSVQYDTRALIDGNGAESLNWQSRYLADDNEVLALDYIDRRLFASDGIASNIDWSSTTGPTTVTQSPNDNSTKIATTAYVDNIAPTWEEFFGGGILGNLTLSGALTLTEDAFYNTLTLNAGASLNTNGYKIFCKTLDLSNAPASAIRRFGNNGNNAANQTGGGTQAGLNAGTTGGGGQGGAGATGTTGVGAVAVVAGSFTNANGGASGAGGQGGAGTPNAGGASRAASTVSAPLDFNRIAFDLLRGAVTIGGGAGGPGGSAGGGDGTNLGRGGGGGGASGAVIAIYAYTIITSGSTASSAIACNGGNGGLGASATVGNVGGGGGGAGAGGGYIYILYANKTGPVVTNLLNANGGNGGNGGNGFGTGTGARGGGGGTGGRIQLFNIPTAIGQKTLGSAGVVGGLNSGLTGGTGGAAGTCNVSF